MEETRYSEKVPGETRNYNWEVSFDINLPDGFVGINQFKDNDHVSDRILLSWSQFEALQEFVRANKASTGRAKRGEKSKSVNGKGGSKAARK